MPAKSKKQQRFMGMVHSVQTGETDPEDVSSRIRMAAKNMKPEDVKKFAKTKHKGLPEKVREEHIRRIIREEVYQIILDRLTVNNDQKSAHLRRGELNNFQRAKKFIGKLINSGMSKDDILVYLSRNRGYVKVFGRNNLMYALKQFR